MKFVNINGNCHCATGKNGRFYIEKRLGMWYGSYVGKTTAFNFPRRKKLRDMKAMMQENEYWEEEKQ